MASAPFGSASGSSSVMRLAPLLLLLIPGLALLARGCYHGPFGRGQVGLSGAEETRLGAQAYHQMLLLNKQRLLPPSDAVVRRVREVGEALADASSGTAFLEATHLAPQNLAWEFRVIDENPVNAFCLPGGKVIVFTGILPVCKDDAGLAAVLSHEMGHALARHGAERLAQQRLAGTGQAALAGHFITLDMPSQLRLFSVLSPGSNVGIPMPYSRRHEAEADKLGLYLMAIAGFDPAQAAELWARMKSAQPSRRNEPADFLVAHPDHDRRMADLRAWAREAHALYERSQRRPGVRPLPMNSGGNGP